MNVKKELIKDLEHARTQRKFGDLICAKIMVDWHESKEPRILLLKVEHSTKDLDQFLADLDFEYDSGFGSQYIAGLIWFEHGWMERGEYGGSEWWEFKKYPEIPKELKQ